MRRWLRLPLYTQIFVAICVGAAVGLLAGEHAGWLKPIGEIFIRLLMMLIVPLTFFTLINGLTRMEDLKTFRSLGGKIVLYYLASSLVAGALGVAAALIIQPGREAVGLLDPGYQAASSNFDFLDNLVSWFPRNPIEALSQGHMLQIIIFAVILGTGLIAMGKRAERLVRLIEDGAELMITITEFVMKLAPYGILALVADMTASFGSRMLADLARFVAADYTALTVLLLALYPPVLHGLGRLSPSRFYRNIAPAMLVAGSTTSSGAALPVSMAVAEDHLGVSEKVWGFTLPLGATVNMNGMAAAVGVISVFAANLYGIPITPALLLRFVFLGLVLSVGTAGVKGAGIVMSGVLLQSLDMPLTLLPILASLWPILDIGHTTCNVTGDLVGTAVVASRMNLLDRGVFRNGGRDTAEDFPEPDSQISDEEA